MFVSHFRIQENRSFVVGYWNSYPSDQSVLDATLNYWQDFFSKTVDDQDDVKYLANQMMAVCMNGSFEIIKLDAKEV